MAALASPLESARDPAPDIPVSVGDVIADKYRIERVVGAGGVGVVFAAEHLKLEERVAIKLLQRTAAQSQENLARFDREARALARIKSEHVARIMDVGALPSGEPFMVMELLEGEDYAAVLRARGKLPVVEAVDAVVQACEGVALSHGLGIVHRDLKPANLFLTRAADGSTVVKVLDFGISKLRTAELSRDQAVTQTLSVVGSPLYMSPEQMESPRDADERADVWSLGVILYEIIAGKPPFEAPTLPLLCARICTAAPTRLSTHVPTIAPELERAILRCLVKDPAKRFGSVAALAQAIAPFGASSTIDRARSIARATTATNPSVEVGSEAPVESPPSTGARRLAWDSSPPPAPSERSGRSLERAAVARRKVPWLVACGAVAVAALAVLSLRAPASAPPLTPWFENFALSTRVDREVTLREALERARRTDAVRDASTKATSRDASIRAPVFETASPVTSVVAPSPKKLRPTPAHPRDTAPPSVRQASSAKVAPKPSLSDVLSER